MSSKFQQSWRCHALPALLPFQNSGDILMIYFKFSAAAAAVGRRVTGVTMSAKKTSAIEKNITADGEVFQLLFENHPVPMIIYDLKTLAFLSVNDAALEQYGYSRDEIKRMNLKDILPDDEVTRLLEDLKQRRPSLQHSGEWRNRLKDGRIVIVEVTSHTLEFEGRKAVLVMAQDITERKQAESQREAALEALRVNEEKFETIFNEAPLGIALIDSLTGRIAAMNPMVANIAGKTMQQMTTVNWLDMIHPDDIQAVRDHAALLNAGQVNGFQNEVRVIHSGGADVWVKLRVVPVNIRDGAHSHYLAMITDITDRKRSEETLIKLKKAVDTSSEAIFLTDIDGVFTYVNPGFSALYGYSADEVVGKTTPRILKSGLVGAQVYVEFWKTLTGGREVKGELINKRKNGKLIDIEGSATPILGDAGRIIGYLGIQRDISPRKQAEDDLRWAVERYQNLFEQSPMMDIVTRNQAGVPVITECNQAFLNTLGYTRAEVVAHPLADFYTPESRASLLDNDGYQRALSGQFVSEGRAFMARDGRVIHTILAATPEINAQGRVVGTRGMYIDITERKKAEEALRVAEANYHALFENATVGIYQSTPQGRFLNVNPVMARIFGYDSPEDMLNNIVSIESQYYVNPEDRRTFQRLMLEQGQVHDLSSWNYRKDGGHILIQENARAVKDAQGNILHYEGFITDITERRQAEDGLHRAKESLEQANRELEGVLAREQHLARTDGLTGLYNYRHFFELASREFDAAMRYQRPLAILMFDADGFKKVNDTLGHIAGDRMLEMVAQAVAAQMRVVDVLARYGGDEFVILLSQTNAQQAFSIAERIRASVAAVRLQTDQGVFSVTLSLGVAELCREPKDDGIERIIQRADQALYAAKQAGRNRTMIFAQE
jgi:diguanylate cyclase (GGDEF)-like protein/PAS domain S-box-containing protein